MPRPWCGGRTAIGPEGKHRLAGRILTVGQEVDAGHERVAEDRAVAGDRHERQGRHEGRAAADGVDEIGHVGGWERLAMEVVNEVEVDRELRSDRPGRLGDR